MPALPLGLLAIAALGSMLAATWPVRMRTLLFAGAVIATAASALSIARLDSRTELFGGGLVIDAYSGFVAAVIALCGVAVLLISVDSHEATESHRGEYVALVLFAVLGGSLMAATEDFVAFFLALQISSIPLYVLAGFNLRNEMATEAAMKFLLLGMVASVIMLYGFSVVFVESGSSRFAEMSSNLLAPATLVGLVFVLLGFAFKVGAAPMHFWIPDTYQGSSVPVATLLSTVPKLGALAALARFASLALADPSLSWSQGVFALLAVASMVLGNLIALVQTDVKRLLAYSSIAHVGYVLVALATGPSAASNNALLFYAVIYVLTNVGAFAVVSAIAGGRHDVPLTSLAGLWKRAPLEAAVLVVLVLSMLGLPPTPGFWAKFAIVSVAIEAGDLWLAALVVLASVVSVVYYIRVVWNVFVAPATEEPLVTGRSTKAVAATVGALTVVVGLWPAGLTDLATTAARAITGGG